MSNVISNLLLPSKVNASKTPFTRWRSPYVFSIESPCLMSTPSLSLLSSTHCGTRVSSQTDRVCPLTLSEVSVILCV